MNACIVVPLFFAKRRRTFNNADDVLELAKYTADVYRNLDTGVPTDIIFVNNSPKEAVGTNFLNSIDGDDSFSGKFIVIEGDNIGMSFGAYNTAFKTFTDRYDLWCFTEDDIIYTGKDFLLKAFNQLNDNQNIGFIATCGLHRGQNSHCDAGAGCTTSDKLLEVVKKYGRLPHSNRVANLTDNAEYKREQIMKGEVAFTNCYQKMGYSMAMINCEDRPFIRWSGSDSETLNKIDLQWWGTTESVNE